MFLSLFSRFPSNYSLSSVEREMELSEHGFLEELLLAPRRDSWSSFNSGLNELFPINGWSLDSFEENPVLVSSLNPQFVGFSTQSSFEECPFTTTTTASSSSYPFVVDGLCAVPEINGTTTPPPFPPPGHQDYPPMVEDEEFGNFLGSENHSSCLELEESKNNDNLSTCKVEMDQQAADHHIIPSAFTMGLCGEKRSSKSKKLEGQPSKNLMAERRRRKRLNDRLSMLRSIVPKISKMDRTSILGDTIDYMKELLERINKLQEEGTEEGTNQISLLGTSKDLNSSEVQVRNSPKFDVEMRDGDTRIDICCAAKPGLLLSTVNTIEALGLEIKQCVISCFNDFSMQASCSEGAEQINLLSPQDIKQALFRNAGYGGRCL
ncbi:transcription factor bHLH93 isoform X1 [Pyrus x bretschneideri]|uniref:transcription factor bHLH93 isoform X1 n=1 Tax=Pyrus x bretschneideri TaxID=225117 RepID=UPI0005113BF8|nr:transcription factor bHLH93 isoform X1 [Pyrus x bretschneideri]